MAPIRRYIRITKYSVLECRIYLDNPALAQTWLLNPRKPALPRIIESVRPYILPKLREERERSRKRSTKKKGIKDTVVEDDFEISVFLTETTTRHSLLTKHKHFHDTAQTKLTSNNPAGHSLVRAASEAPIDVDVDNDDDPALTAILRREESDDYDAGAVLAEIPEAPGTHNPAGDNSGRPPKRARRNTAGEGGDPENGGRSDVEYIPGDDDDDPQDEDDDEDDDGLFVDPEERHGNMGLPPAKRRKGGTAAAAAGEEGDGGRDDKKKLAMDISYEGFSIYGRVLCLVVKRRGDGSGSSSGGGGVTVSSGAGGGRGGNASAKTGGQGQAMMENFIISTQVPAGMEAQ